jgi:hypothetical protein
VAVPKVAAALVSEYVDGDGQPARYEVAVARRPAATVLSFYYQTLWQRRLLALGGQVALAPSSSADRSVLTLGGMWQVCVCVRVRRSPHRS